jgi:hypothetical protein
MSPRFGPIRSDAPADIKRAAIDVLNELLVAFFGVDEDSATYGLAETLAATVPYWPNATSQPMPFTDADIEWLVARTRQWCSLPTQRKLLRSAADHEFTRARRVLRIVFGLFRRVVRRFPIDQREALEEHGRLAVIVLGRATLLPLMAILRDPSIAPFIPTLLRLCYGMKRQIAQP